MLLLGAVAGAGVLAIQSARAQRADQSAALQLLRQELKALQNQPQRAPDFTSQLPKPQRIDDVVRDIGNQAQAVGMEVRSLALQPVAGTPQELAKIQISLAATAEYKAAKTWLGELLGRHPSLAVEALSLRAAGGDPIRAELQATLVLFVRD